jgi:hypothetical protein
MSYEQSSIYFDAAMYAYQVLGVAAPKYLARLQQLAQYNSSEELHAIVDSWCPKDALASRPAPKAPKAPAPDLWTAGSQWGSAVRVARDRGIIWKLKCQCGKNFELSTNDTTPEHLRKCPTCILADEFSETKKEIVSRLDETSKIVLEWHRAHDKLIWNRVHKACAKRGITSADWSTTQFKKELHALVWVKIAEKVGQYRDQGFKPSAWLGRVADNTIKDFFKVNDNRSHLAPMVPMVTEAVAPATRPEEVLPAKKTQPEGASPHPKATNMEQRGWDKALNWNG